MTTVTIGSYPTAPRPTAPEENRPTPEETRPAPESPAAPAPAPKREEESPRVFSAPVSVRRRLPLRAVFAVRLLLAAGAGLFVWLGGTFGSAELRAAIAEAVGRALNG